MDGGGRPAVAGRECGAGRGTRSPSARVRLPQNASTPMKTAFSRLLPLLALSLAPLLLAARPQVAPVQSRITGHTLLPVGELKWVPLPGIAGAQQALLWGDPAKGEHRAFFRYPVGLRSPLHTHSRGDRGVVVSGTLSLAVEGAAPVRLPPGSYFSLAGGVKHVTTVEGDEPCVFLIEREGPFDVVLAEGKQ